MIPRRAEIAGSVMKLRLRDGMVITVMPYPKRKRPRQDDEFEPHLKRWIHLTIEERQALMARMKTHRRSHWARQAYLPWAGANLRLPTLPCEGVTVISYSESEEDALRAYWEGWLEESEKIWDLRWKWPTLSRAQRTDALVLAELMAADLPIARGLRDWMRNHLEDGPEDADLPLEGLE